MADNQTMQPSGEVGRFEVVDLPSPPADRQRYLTETTEIQHWGNVYSTKPNSISGAETENVFDAC